MNSQMSKGIVVGLLLMLSNVCVLAQTTSDLPLDLVRTWSSGLITVRGLGSEIARLESKPPASLIIVAAKISPPIHIERTTAVRTVDDKCCAGLSIVLDDSRRINSWEVRLITPAGARVEPVAVVVLDRMAYLNGRTLAVSSVETNANLDDVFASAGNTPKILFLYELKGSISGLKWQVRDSEPKVVHLQSPK
jgi:hypothetical protein